MKLSGRKNIAYRLPAGSRAVWLLLLTGIISLIVGVVDGKFLSPGVWQDILVRSAPTAIVACGLMLIVVTGEIDISVGSLMALLAAVMGILISESHFALSPWIGIPLTLLLGSLIGLLTGVLVTFGRVPSIIATLGLLTGLRGITTLVMGGENIDRLPETVSRLAKQGFCGMPVSVWCAGAICLLTFGLIRHTRTGWQIYAIGSSPESARIAGLPVRRLRILVFVWTGLLTALATVVDVPRLPKIESGIGLDFELLVITCVVTGGVAVSGGRGQLSGVLAAVVLMTMVRPVLTFLDVGEAGEKWTKAVQGTFILMAVVSDRFIVRNSLREQQQ